MYSFQVLGKATWTILTSKCELGGKRSHFCFQNSKILYTGEKEARIRVHSEESLNIAGIVAVGITLARIFFNTVKCQVREIHAVSSTCIKKC